MSMTLTWVVLPAVRSQGYLGCFSAAALTGTNWTDLPSPVSTLQSCASAASQRNFAYAALLGKSTCRGGNSLPGAQVSASLCLTPCGSSTSATPGSYQACAATTSNGAVFSASAVLGKWVVYACFAASGCGFCCVNQLSRSCL